MTIKNQTKCAFGLCVWIARFQRAIQCLRFWLGPMALFMTSQKRKNTQINAFLGLHSTIHTFKNYFVTIFLIINFQFLANKRHSNTHGCVWIPIKNKNYFTIQLIFIVIYGSHCIFWYYLSGPLYYFN